LSDTKAPGALAARVSGALVPGKQKTFPDKAIDDNGLYLLLFFNKTLKKTLLLPLFQWTV
jgi:hypothetical protein